MQDQFWYPQFGGDDSGSEVVSAALNQFVSLFGGGEYQPNSPLTSKPNDLFNFDSLLEKLEEGIEDDLILVVGTCSKEKAIEHSWDQLGLNLFDLPWFGSEKAFRYVNATSLFEDVHALKLLLSDRDGVEEEVDHGRVREQLEWARCHRFANDVQNAVGHGERDRLQVKDSEDIAEDLDDELVKWGDRWEDHIEGCPACQRLRERVQGLVSEDGERGEEYAREVADLDSREYRYARTIFQDENPVEEKWEHVKYVITIDDDDQVEKVLGDKLAEVIIDCQEKDPDALEEKKVYRYRGDEGLLFVESAEETESMKRYSLVDDEGEDIIRRITDSGVTCFEEGKGSREDPLELETTDVLACFDLDLDKQAEGLSETLHGGLWVMYGTACQYPRVSRMVVTGYRSQALFGHGAGTHGYLMKPFSKASLENELERAQEVRRVAWYCPSPIQADYESSLRRLVEHSADDLSFEAVRNLLGRRLRDEGVSLEVIDDIEGADEVSTIARSDLLILDPFRVTDMNEQVLPFPNLHPEAGSSGGNELSRLIKNIRSLDPEIPLLLLLPAGSATKGEQWKPESVVANYLRGSPLRLQEGKDGVFRKPFWISADGHSDQNAGLANKILFLLSDQDEFDIKYQVLVPVAAILGRLGEEIRKIKSLMYEEGENLDVVFASLLPFLVRAYGLSASLHDLKAIESVRLAHDLRQEIQRDQKQNDWSGVDTDTVNEVLTYFAETAISAPVIQRHVTLENWMRKRVDRRAAEKYREELYDPEIQDMEEDQSDFEDIGPLTRPLSLIFGGSTRYEFSVRGSWYKSAKERVDDILIVVEFAARSSIVARSIIKDLAVHYLSKVAGEEAVMAQEISTDAHVWPDS